jgi:hypothetical protein
MRLITLMMETVQTSETSVNLHQSTQCCNPEDSNFCTHHCENLKPYLDLMSQVLVTCYFEMITLLNLPVAVHDRGSLCPSLVFPQPAISAPALSGWTPAFPEHCEHHWSLRLQNVAACQNHGTETLASPCCPPGSQVACLSHTKNILNKLANKKYDLLEKGRKK